MLQTQIKPRIYSPYDLSRLNWDKLPKHVALIPDGNRRWATQSQLNIVEGHREGANSLIETAKAACELNIDVLTFYLFSTENWARSEFEVKSLMWLLHDFLIREHDTMLEYGIKMNTIGSLTRLPEYVQETIQQTKAVTEQCTQLEMVLAINYGSRDEISRAVRKIVNKCQKGELSEIMITEECIAQHLDTCAWKDPELLIRTSGELRLSNYLLWQLSYSEIYITDTMWPDFRSQHLLEALLNYQTRQRRLGKL